MKGGTSEERCRLAVGVQYELCCGEVHGIKSLRTLCAHHNNPDCINVHRNTWLIIRPFGVRTDVHPLLGTKRRVHQHKTLSITREVPSVSAQRSRPILGMMPNPS